ncbi:MAG: hypothetical protein WCW87_01495 [Candidatus Paceibacterota bacterium]
METKYSTEVGKYLVIHIIGDIHFFIAEVVTKDPLVIKITEEGLLSVLKQGDYVIYESFSADIQNIESQNNVIEKFKMYSGLRSLGVTDGKIYEICPD